MTYDPYLESIYAGVLGKIIGVYLGRPFEGWDHDRIMEYLGEINYYVNDKFNVPLVVTDDDISGTFTFLRSMQDHNYPNIITPSQIGETWLNYLIENRTVLWWGGLGNSTEHTAYLRLKKGIIPPMSGSIQTNGKVVAEQIGSQIFIDGWAMICPGDPEKAVFLAKQAASVSHDGEAIFGAQIIAAIESSAFVEKNLDQLLNTALGFIPKDSIIYRLIQDLREWREAEPSWIKTRKLIETNYGYDRYGGNCHIVPNHALIHLGLLYGEDNFQKTMMITNTSGWDTDCNSGNVGCIMGIKNGLSGINQNMDWCTPVADQIFLPTADGGRAITDAVKESFFIYNTYRMINKSSPVFPKSNAKFHFELPGSVQGFRVYTAGNCKIENVQGHSKNGTRSLAIIIASLQNNSHIKIQTPTFVQPDELNMSGYSLFASPTLYPGQIISARLEADKENIQQIIIQLVLSVYGENDNLEDYCSNEISLSAGEECLLKWEIDDSICLINKPIAKVGISIKSNESLTNQIIYLDYLTWDGSPKITFQKPDFRGTAWRKSWVNAVDVFESHHDTFRIIQNEGRGYLIYGSQDWTDYHLKADITPHLVQCAGIAARFQGLQRYYAFLLSNDGTVKLIKKNVEEIMLAQKSIDWSFGQRVNLTIKVEMNQICCFWDDSLVFDITDKDDPFLFGAIALVAEEGRSATQSVSIFPI